MKDDGGPAFPAAKGFFSDERSGEVVRFEGVAGMSLRDYFASQIMPSIMIIMNGKGQSLGKIYSPAEVSKEAFVYADAMLAEREK